MSLYDLPEFTPQHHSKLTSTALEVYYRDCSKVPRYPTHTSAHTNFKTSRYSGNYKASHSITTTKANITRKIQGWIVRRCYSAIVSYYLSVTMIHMLPSSYP